MEVLAIIPARSGSKSVKDKNIREINGKPMLAYSIEHGLKSEKINRVIVSTDSEKYAEIAKKYGAEVPFLRPEEYARDTSLDLEVFEHALKFLKEKEGYVPDIIVQLRPTYPIRKISDIDKMVEIMEQDETIDSVRCIAPAKEIPYKMWLKGENGEIHPLMTDIPECYNMPRQELPKAYYQNACIDVIRTRVITEEHSMSGKKIIGYEMNENFDIDTEEEFLKAAEWIREQNKKKVSVIIPCYNAENVLDNCLESLTAQTIGIENLEIILVNDASTDGTYDRLCQWEQKYPDSIMVINCTENGRQGRARNIGLEYAGADYIGYMDIDDIAEPEMFEELYRKAMLHDAEVVICQSRRCTLEEYRNGIGKTDSTEEKVYFIQQGKDRLKFLQEDYNMAVWNKLYKKEFLQTYQIDFPEGMLYEDIYFSSLVKRYAVKVCVIRKVLYNHIRYEESSSINDNQKVKEDYLHSYILLYKEIQRRGLYQGYENYYDMELLISGYYVYIHFMFVKFGYLEPIRWNRVRKEVLGCFPDGMREELRILIENFEQNHKEYNGTWKIIMNSLERPVTRNEVIQMMQIIQLGGMRNE